MQFRLIKVTQCKTTPVQMLKIPSDDTVTGSTRVNVIWGKSVKMYCPLPRWI